MIIVNKVNMDLTQPGFVPVVNVVQNDRYSRALELTLYSGGEVWSIPEEASAVIRYSKSDGKEGLYDALPNGEKAWSAAENVLTVMLAPQVLTAAGAVQLEVSLLEKDVQITTFSILLNVRASVQGGAASENYQNVTGFVPGPVSAEVGQFFRIAAVDAQGRVLQVDAVDLAEEFGGGEPKEDDIPRVFLSGTIPTTKEEVLAEMTYVSRTEVFSAYLKIKCQGNSSMNYPKKNFTIKMYSDDSRKNKLKKIFRDWGYDSYKYVLKANYIDHSHARNIVSARLWNEVVASRSGYASLPEELRLSPRNGAIDGFPVKLYANGTYQGIYTWNIGKEDWMWGMDEDNENHVLMCGETNTNGVFGATACNFRTLWSGTDGADWSVEVGTNSDAVKDSLNTLIDFVMHNTGEKFKAGIGEYLDVQSALDYFLFSYVSCGLDSLARNMLLATYDGKKWYCGQYDMDSTFGLWWDGSSFVSAEYACPEDYQEPFSLLWERFLANYTEELKQRYAQLRSGALSLSNMVTHFERIMDVIGSELYAEDLTIYTTIPSGSTNNIQQLRNFIRDRLDYVDEKMAVLGEEEEETENTTLPEEYTQMNYLIFSGTQYIDTGVTGGTEASYEIKFNMLGQLATTYEQYFAGGGVNTAPKLYFKNGDGMVVAQCSNVEAEGCWRLSWNDAVPRTIRYESVAVKLYMDNVEQTNYAYVPTGSYAGCGWGDTSWYVGTSPTESEFFASMHLYFLKMYSGGELVRNYVPVVRNTDSVAGLFDLVTQTFYENAGTGVFEAGI